jgi:hypothetical protein
VIKTLVHSALFALLISPAGAIYGQVPQIEREALVALYNSTDGANWTDNTGWLGEVGTECSWFGVICLSGSVSRLSFFDNSLTGSIPPELGNLKNLSYLSLASNSFTGTIPKELGNLTKLISLNLAAPNPCSELWFPQYYPEACNSLTGSIPKELGELTSLKTLILTNNRLSGSIPKELGNLTNLNQLWLEWNMLSGPIPTEFSGLINLTSLFLTENSLEGDMTELLKSMTKLTSLKLRRSGLSGFVPKAVYEKGDLNAVQQGFRPWLGLLHNQHYIEDIDQDGIDDSIDKDLASSAPIKVITTPDYSISILGSGRVVNLVSNSTYANDFKDFVSGPKPTSSDIKRITKILYENFEDEFDFIQIVPSCVDPGKCITDKGNTYGINFSVKNDVKGIGGDLLDLSEEYGSGGKLKSVSYFPHMNGVNQAPSLHEFMHTWANRLTMLDPLRGTPIKGSDNFVCRGHWGWSNVGGQLGGWRPHSLKMLSDGSYQAKGTNTAMVERDLLLRKNKNLPEVFWNNYAENHFGDYAQGDNEAPYGNLELYMMGLIGADEIGHDVKIAQDFSWKDKQKGIFNATAINTLTIEHIIAKEGPRIPSHEDSQKAFRTMYVIVSDRPLELNEWGYIDKEIYNFQLQGDNGYPDYNFWEATQGKATMTYDSAEKFLKKETAETKVNDASNDSAAGVDDLGKNLEWPSPYNGVTPDKNFELSFNNIGVFSSSDAIIYSCLRLFTDGLLSSSNGISQFDIGLQVVSLADTTVQITKSREFNATGALNENAQPPDCSGQFETTTSLYTDIIQVNSSVLETVWSLIDSTKLILKLVSSKELIAN